MNWKSRGAVVPVFMLMPALFAGCGAMSAPLANIEPGGRDYAKVNDDKAACWQAAEATHGAHSRTRWMVAPVPVNAAMQASSGADLAARDVRIEADAERCMVERGYTIGRKSETSSPPRAPDARPR